MNSEEAKLRRKTNVSVHCKLLLAEVKKIKLLKQ